MTREEAIKILKGLRPQPQRGDGKSTTHLIVTEALNLAIKALEQEPCEAAVSRQAVKDGMIKYGFHASDMTITEFVEDVLPPVTPVACIAEFRFSKEDMQDLVDEKIKEIVVERKKGKWIIDDEEDGRIWNCHCSECKKDPQDYIVGTENRWLVQLPNYCPNCGLEMEIEE